MVTQIVCLWIRDEILANFCFVFWDKKVTKICLSIRDEILDNFCHFLGDKKKTPKNVKAVKEFYHKGQ